MLRELASPDPTLHFGNPGRRLGRLKSMTSSNKLKRQCSTSLAMEAAVEGKAWSVNGRDWSSIAREIGSSAAVLMRVYGCETDSVDERRTKFVLEGDDMV